MPKYYIYIECEDKHQIKKAGFLSSESSDLEERTSVMLVDKSSARVETSLKIAISNANHCEYLLGRHWYCVKVSVMVELS